MNTRTETIVAPRLRDAVARLGGERILTHNSVVAAGTMAAGALGVAFQSAVSHQFRPQDYAGLFAIVTVLTVIGIPAGAFTLLMAREASHARATGHATRSASLLRQGNRALLMVGVVLAISIVLAAPLLSKVFGLQAPSLLAASVGIPFTIALPLLIGQLQGDERFGAYALLTTGQAGAKVVAGVGLGMVLGPTGTILGISAATIAAYLIATRMVRRNLAVRSHLPWLSESIGYLAVVLPSTIALASLLSSDVLLVKHFFPSAAAGEYSAVAALGRAIFWGASGIAIVLFPKMSFHRAQGRSAGHVLTASLLILGLGALIGLAILTVASTTLLSAFAGPAYISGAPYLPWYAAGMTMLGIVALLTASFQSRGRPGFLMVLLPLAAIEPLLMAIFHGTLMQVVQVLDLSVALVAAGLFAWYVIQGRLSRAIAGTNGVIPAAIASTAVPLHVSQ